MYYHETKSSEYSVVSLDQFLWNPLAGFETTDTSSSSSSSLVALDGSPLITVVHKKLRNRKTVKKTIFPLRCHLIPDDDDDDEDEDDLDENDLGICSITKTKSSDDLTTSTVPMECSETEDEDMTDKNTTKQRRHVTFAPFDRVIMIPSIDEYTQEERDRMWTSCAEVDANARQSQYEFRWEGSNWQTVLEEDDFILCSDGKRYHPARVYAHMQYLRQVEEHHREQEQERAEDYEEQQLELETLQQVQHSRHRNTILAFGIGQSSTSESRSRSKSGNKKIKRTDIKRGPPAATKAGRKVLKSRAVTSGTINI